MNFSFFIVILSHIDKVKSFIEYLINEVNSLKYEDEPNYFSIQNKINETLKACGYSNEENFQLLFNNSVSKTLKLFIGILIYEFLLLIHIGIKW